MNNNPDSTPENPNPAPKTGVGGEGISSIVLGGEVDQRDFSNLIEAMISKLQAELRIKVIDETTFSAISSYIEGLEIADRSISSVTMGDIIVIDDDTEPQIALFSRPIYKGSDERIYYMLTGENALNEDYFKSMREHIDSDREWQEIALAITDSVKAPYGQDDIIYPIDVDDTDADITNHAELLTEVAIAHSKGIINDDQLKSIQAALLLRDILKQEFASIGIFKGDIERGGKSRYYRVYKFPESRKNLEDGENND